MMASKKNAHAPEWLMEFMKQQKLTRQEERRQQELVRQEERRQQEETIHALMSVIQSERGEAEIAQNSQAASTKIQASRPSTLDIETSYSKFLGWRSSWNDYVMLQKLHQFPIEIQKAQFRSCLSEEMRNLLKCGLDIQDDCTMSIDEILNKIQAYLRQKRNVALDRVAFEERKQQVGETFDQFYVCIKKLADEADLCKNCIEQRLNTKIMSGLRNQIIRQKLLAITPFPSLKDTIEMCRSHEAAEKGSEAFSLQQFKWTKYLTTIKEEPNHTERTMKQNNRNVSDAEETGILSTRLALH